MSEEEGRLRSENEELAKQLALSQKLNQRLWDDNRELAAKCKEHFNNCQLLMRHQLVESTEKRVTSGTINGTRQTFTLE